MARDRGYWVEVSALARVRIQVFVKAETPEEAKQEALKKIALGEISRDEWHYEGEDQEHEILKVRGG